MHGRPRPAGDAGIERLHREPRPALERRLVVARSSRRGRARARPRDGNSIRSARRSGSRRRVRRRCARDAAAARAPSAPPPGRRRRRARTRRCRASSPGRSAELAEQQGELDESRDHPRRHRVAAARAQRRRRRMRAHARERPGLDRNALPESGPSRRPSPRSSPAARPLERRAVRCRHEPHIGAAERGRRAKQLREQHGGQRAPLLGPGVDRLAVHPREPRVRRDAVDVARGELAELARRGRRVASLAAAAIRRSATATGSVAGARPIACGQSTRTRRRYSWIVSSRTSRARPACTLAASVAPRAAASAPAAAACCARPQTEKSRGTVATASSGARPRRTRAAANGRVERTITRRTACPFALEADGELTLDRHRRLRGNVRAGTRASTSARRGSPRPVRGARRYRGRIGVRRIEQRLARERRHEPRGLVVVVFEERRKQRAHLIVADRIVDGARRTRIRRRGTGTSASRRRRAASTARDRVARARGSCTTASPSRRARRPATARIRPPRPAARD